MMTETDPALRAELPYTGPTPDPTPPLNPGSLVRITGSVDPARGEAYMAAFVQVKRNGDSLEPTGAVFSEIRSDKRGLFTLEAADKLWAGVDGVLVALIYDVNLRDLKPRVEDALEEAVKDLFKRETARELMKGVVRIGRWLDAPSKEGMSFALASCQYPETLLDMEVARDSGRRLAKSLGSPDGPQFLLLVGDQVYVDPTAGMFDPTTPYERFEQTYQRAERALSQTGVAAQLPAYKMLDDHEIVDNWEPLIYEGRPDPDMVTGRAYYLDYQRRPGPPRVEPVGDSTEP